MLFNSPELESVTGFENVTRRYPLSWPKMTIIYSTCGTGHHHITALGNGSTTMVVCEDGVMGTVTFKSGSNVKLPLFSMAPLFALVVPLLSVKFPMVTRTPLMIKNILFFFSASIMVPVWPWPIMFMVFVDGYAPGYQVLYRLHLLCAARNSKGIKTSILRFKTLRLVLFSLSGFISPSIFIP